MTELILIVFGTILASAAHLILRDHTDEKRRASLMHATRANTSEDWDEKGDATRCDEGVSDTLDIVENAVK
jgi:hypothetical protein